MNLGYVNDRFCRMMNAYVGENIGFIRRSFYFVDWLFAFLVHGASISDYFAYSFYKSRCNGRTEYITYRRYKRIQNKCNKIIGDRNLCRDKIKFNTFFSNYIGREWIDVNKCSFREFEAFFRARSRVFVKEINSFRGIGVQEYSTKDTNVESLYGKLKKENESHYILEEKISQTGELSAFHPWSVNTIRIVTVYDENKDIVYLMNARLRMGNKQNCVDNFHFDGIGANIDIETGVVTSIGYDTHNNTYIKHPITGKQIIGFKIPYWEKCRQFVERSARHIPTVRYIGWDIVLQGDGKLLLIEGNDNADHDFQQLHNCGLWKQYKKIITSLS